MYSLNFAEKKYWDVSHKYHDTLKILYFMAKKRESENASIFVPRCSTDGLSFNQMQALFELQEGCET